MKTLSLAIFIFGYLSQQSQAQGGPCHPYPGAVAQDCLELIGNNLRNDTMLDLTTTNPVILSLKNCSIVTKRTSSIVTEVSVDAVVRMALTEIGQCALSDYGSVSGHYTNSDDGVKVCYLYPGQ